MEFKSDYYYGNEGSQYTFYRIPKILFTEPKFKGISNDARVLYGLMLDRMGLSVKNEWRDDNNRIYIYFTLDDIQNYMNCGHTKGGKIISELENINLIERVRQGQGKPARIYIKKFFTVEDSNCEESNNDFSENCENSNSDFSKQENESTVNEKSRLPQNGSLDYRKMEVQISANEKSRLPQNGSLDYRKTAANNNKYNNTEFSNNESVSKSMSCLFGNTENDCDTDCDYDIDSCCDSGITDNPETTQNAINTLTDTYEKQKQIENYIKRQVNYARLISGGLAEKDEVDSLVFIITETLLSDLPAIRIGGEDKPASVVKSVLSKVDYGMIVYTIGKFKEQKHQIVRKKAYLLTCLYNARIEGVYNGINYLNSLEYG